MVNINKTITLSQEVYFKLKNEKNASALVDALLFKHYQEQDISMMSKEQIEQRIKQIEKSERIMRESKEAEEKLKQLEKEKKENGIQ